MLIFYSDSELLSLGALEGALFDVTSLDDFGVFSLFGTADFDSWGSLSLGAEDDESSLDGVAFDELLLASWWLPVFDEGDADDEVELPVLLDEVSSDEPDVVDEVLSSLVASSSFLSLLSSS